MTFLAYGHEIAPFVGEVGPLGQGRYVVDVLRLLDDAGALMDTARIFTQGVC